MANKTALPYLTGDLPGIHGTIRMSPEDFIVEEIPLYEPCGSGEHFYLWLEKRDLSTLQVIKIISQALHIDPMNIGYAGMKDRNAVTRQYLSISGVQAQEIDNLNLRGIEILSVKRHKNKLKLGHLAGNHFIIRLREVPPDAEAAAGKILKTLKTRGIPNYFGEQRFGIRGNTHTLGLLLIKNEIQGFYSEFLGRPLESEPPEIRQARSAFETHEWEKAMEAWPYGQREERNALAALIKYQGNGERALKTLDRRLIRLFFSAAQSHLFNLLLAERLRSGTMSLLETGDVAFLHRNGACFLVENAAAEQPRAETFEISPSGPMFGKKLLMAQGEPGKRERELLQSTGIELERFSLPGLKMEGERRPYRIPLSDMSIGMDDGLRMEFTLPAGAYATTVLREIQKNEVLLD